VKKGIAGIVIMIVVHSSNSPLMFMKLKMGLIIFQVLMKKVSYFKEKSRWIDRWF